MAIRHYYIPTYSKLQTQATNTKSNPPKQWPFVTITYPRIVSCEPKWQTENLPTLVAGVATKIQTHWDWQCIVSQIPNRQTTPVFHQPIRRPIYKQNTKRSTITKHITDTSYISIRNPDDARHTCHPPIDLNLKIQFKKQLTARQHYLTASRPSTSVSYVMQLFKCAPTKSTHGYNRDPSPKIRSTPDLAGTTTLCEQTASLTWIGPLKIKKIGQHAHKPNAINYSNTSKIYS